MVSEACLPLGGYAIISSTTSSSAGMTAPISPAFAEIMTGTGHGALNASFKIEH
jgi:hypothetical protein